MYKMMKKIYTSILFIGLAFFATAQVTIELSVDMNGVAEFDPASDVMKVGGDFQGWSDADTPMADDDGDGVYTVMVEGIDAGSTLLFKFIINEWETNEFHPDTPGEPGDCTIEDGGGNINRQEDVPADATATYALPTYKYNSCEVSELSSNVVNPTSTIKGITIAPNPFTDRAVLTLDTPVFEAHDIRITNINGQVVKNIQGFQGQSLEINRDNLTAGMYFLMLTNQKGEIATSRLMISK